MLSSPVTFTYNVNNIQRLYVCDVQSWSLQKWETPLLVFLHALSLFNFLKSFVLFFILCIADFCEVVCRGILYQDLCYSLLRLLYLTHHRDKTWLSCLAFLCACWPSVCCLVHCHFCAVWWFLASLPFIDTRHLMCGVVVMALINDLETWTHFR